MPPEAMIGIVSRFGRGGDQDQARDVVLAGMAGALEAVDRDRVDAERLGLERVAHRRRLVDDLDAGGLEVGQVLDRVRAGGLDDRDAGLDDRLAVLRVGRRLDRRQDRQVDAERRVGQLARAGDLARQILGRRLRQRGQEAERAGVRDGGDELRPADPLHAALDDRVLDFERVGEACAEHGGGWSPKGSAPECRRPTPRLR